MGLGGIVNCRCWKDAGLDGPIGFDEDGWLDLLDVADPAAYRWYEAGCEHDDFEIAHEDLGSWGGQSAVRQTCAAIGWELLPTLHRFLPTTNDGWIPVADVPALLAELDRYESRVGTVTETVLVDEDTGHSIYGCVAANTSIIGWNRNLQAGIDQDGFFVRSTGLLPRIVFRATRFTQREMPGDRVEFVGDRGRATLRLFLVGHVLPVTPARLAVVTRSKPADSGSGWIASMRRLCAASLATGNPVKWT
ncbi:hypothetical protein Q0Z83_037270 [Actinoplanes sichuanensis]|uniref:Uncharacterized protein n=1 Tax=Actinoplanes sichuanensis TaxID=512349 RepID=A0ABW4A4D9_9ACTN|nr:hypothetical protein [Actinoplanes sichuanensis]BEL05536.1 hypothetical protein Q0Z83_037270 [Actinoplanes sichuanensis]